MPLQIRRGTDTQRAGIPFAEGELVYTIDTKKVYVGDGSTLGGILIDTSLSFPPQTGNQGKYLTTDGNTVSWSTLPGGGGGLTSVSDDPFPALGGNLSLNSHNITNTGNIDITGSFKSTNGSDFLQINGSVITKDTFHSVTIDGSTSSRAPFVVYQPTTQPGLEVRAYGASGALSPALSLVGYRGAPDNPQVLEVGDPTGAIAFASAKPGRTDIATATAIIGAQLAVPGDGVTTSGQSQLNFIIPALDGSLGPGSQVANFAPDGVFSAPIFGAGDGDATTPSIRFNTDGGKDSGLFHPGDGIVCVSINAQEKIRVDSGGMRVEGFMKVGGYATSSLPNPAEAGMIVLDTDTGQFKGYTGSGWVALN